MKLWPDQTDRPRVVKSGSAKGSIVNYWPPKTARGMARLVKHNTHVAQAEWEREHKARMVLLKREMRVLADEIRAGRRRLRECDMALVLIALRKYEPK